MTCQTYSFSDLYEIHYTPTGVSSIIRYRHGLDGPGEQVTFEELHPKTQNALFLRLKKALHDDRHTKPSPFPDDHHQDRGGS